jgi:SnoaL-like domain
LIEISEPTIEMLSGTDFGKVRQNGSDHEQVRQTVSRYTRAADSHDKKGYIALFAPKIFFAVYIHNTDEGIKVIYGPFHTPEKLGASYFDSDLIVRPSGVWSHHFTTDLLIDSDGGRARVNAQLLYPVSVADPKYNSETVDQNFGPRGALTPQISGYYAYPFSKSRRGVEDR